MQIPETTPPSVHAERYSYRCEISLAGTREKSFHDNCAVFHHVSVFSLRRARGICIHVRIIKQSVRVEVCHVFASHFRLFVALPCVLHPRIKA